MKSIKDTFGIIQDIIKRFPADMEIALVGGYAAVLHGVERTTLDVDFCVYSSLLHSSNGSTQLHGSLVKCLPDRYEVKLISFLRRLRKSLWKICRRN